MRKAKNKKESKQPDLNERCQRWFAYWGVWEFGYVYPKWIENMAGREAIKIYEERYFTHSEHFEFFGCAIELEHRSRPVSTPKELRRIAKKITRMGYDFTAAAALSEEVKQESIVLSAEIKANEKAKSAERARREAEAYPERIRILRELRERQLPKGARANLALIRTQIGLPTKDFSKK